MHPVALTIMRKIQCGYNAMTNDMQLIHVTAEPKHGVRTATLSLLAAYLVRVVKEKMACSGCLEGTESSAPASPIPGLILNIDRGVSATPHQDL